MSSGKKEVKKEGSENGKKKEDLLRFLSEKKEHGVHKKEEEKPWSEIKENESNIFELLKFGHLLVFLALFFQFSAKKRGWDNVA